MTLLGNKQKEPWSIREHVKDFGIFLVLTQLGLTETHFLHPGSSPVIRSHFRESFPPLRCLKEGVIVRLLLQISHFIILSKCEISLTTRLSSELNGGERH